ncbi:hypothetical protein MMG00_13695 [Ignatzschineria rhizosphaerae]|uniref:DUF2975 domain-containing protein n=1 Tax=Ignatzschineria rhizosphaerae TaxID=2923279 RepID=A0ABY3X3F3_9GAMM|nr:hypothetical protein [Ignatzschineria rhizosphaerae]UNM96229.1 hypothetical protein MMG00_13695 [Ignatzschineria rhizosphaerae]
MTIPANQRYQENQRGRITLTFFYLFGLFTLITFAIAYTVLNIMVADRIQDAIQLSRIVPFSIITFSAVLPLGLILGFWMSGYGNKPLDGTFRLAAARRGFILTFLYLLILLGFVLMIDEPIANMLGLKAFNYKLLIAAPIGAVLGAIYAYICAIITAKFSKVAKNYDEHHPEGRVEDPSQF